MTKAGQGTNEVRDIRFRCAQLIVEYCRSHRTKPSFTMAELVYVIDNSPDQDFQERYVRWRDGFVDRPNRGVGFAVSECIQQGKLVRAKSKGVYAIGPSIDSDIVQPMLYRTSSRDSRRFEQIEDRLDALEQLVKDNEIPF